MKQSRELSMDNFDQFYGSSMQLYAQMGGRLKFEALPRHRDTSRLAMVRTATARRRHIHHASWYTRKSGPHGDKPAPRATVVALARSTTIGETN